jgi:hypothetical protein
MRYPKTEAPAPTALTLDRRRLTKFIVALPLLIIACGWLASQVSVAFSQVDKHVALAERVPGSTPIIAEPGNQNSAILALARAQQDPKAMLTRAVEIRHRFATGGWWFGGFVGLVLGIKLISLSLHARRTDYEPDRGACVACARCFMSCPNEHARRGLVFGGTASLAVLGRNLPPSGAPDDDLALRTCPAPSAARLVTRQDGPVAQPTKAKANA